MANLFPSGSLETTNLIDSSSLSFKGTYAFDFETGEFIRNTDGSIKILNTFEAYVQWCQKTMLTSRYKYSSYSSKFGKDIIGSTLDKKAIELELKRITQEALLVHPMTESVDTFAFTWESSDVYYTYKVTSTTGQTATLTTTEKVG